MAALHPVQLPLKLPADSCTSGQQNLGNGSCSCSSTRELGVSGLQDREIRDDQELSGGRLSEAVAAGSGGLCYRVRCRV